MAEPSNGGGSNASVRPHQSPIPCRGAGGLWTIEWGHGRARERCEDDEPETPWVVMRPLRACSGS